MADQGSFIVNSTAPPPSSIAPPTPGSGAHHFLSIKLNSTNHIYWNTQVVPYLIGHRIYDYVIGDKPCPDDPEKAAEWRVQDAAIMSLLITSLDKDALPLAVGRLSEEIWDALTTAFSNPNTPRILALNFALQNLVHKHDETISQFVHRAKELFDELAAAGKPLPIKDINIIFRSLREEYQSVVPTMMYRQPSLSYSELHGLLMSHESLITS
ncbi:uncharacterized protein LOC122664443 [Telopea speciosissima]|uniref:uncharacterized protein LOC122664443 n=1 Tax=Telopea speciosissima TaxID=54955 RepID=UPI001CC7C7BF|nr:uncharacterized protein LOC122664443 [Telopea speciosissima]